MSIRVPPKSLSGTFILQVVIDNQVTCNIRTRNGISVKDALAEKLENTGGRKWQNFIVYTKWTRVLIDWEMDVLCVRGHALIVVNKMDPSPIPLPGSHHFLPTELIQQAILPHCNKDFWYILRPSGQTPGQFALAISTPTWPTSSSASASVSAGGILRHVKITFDEESQNFSLCKKHFTDLDSLLECFKFTPIKAHNGPNMYLRNPVPVDKRLEEECKKRFKIYRTEPELEDDDNISLWSQGTPSCSYNYDASVSGISDLDEEEDERTRSSKEEDDRTRSSTIVSPVSSATNKPTLLQTIIDESDNPTFETARRKLMLSFENSKPLSRPRSSSPEAQIPAKECGGSSDSDVIMRGSSNSSSSASGSFGQGSVQIQYLKRNKKQSTDDQAKVSTGSSPRASFASKLFKRKPPKDMSRPHSEFGSQVSQDSTVSTEDTYMTMELSEPVKDLDSSLDIEFGETTSTIIRGSDPIEHQRDTDEPSEVYEDMTHFDRARCNSDMVIYNNNRMTSNCNSPDEAYEDMSRWCPTIRTPEIRTPEIRTPEIRTSESEESITNSLAMVDNSDGTYEDMSRLSPRPQHREGCNTISVHSIPSDQECQDEDIKENNSTLTRANTTKGKRMSDEERRSLTRDRRAKSQYMIMKSSDQHQYDKPSAQHLYQNTGSLRKRYENSGNLENHHYDNTGPPHQCTNTTNSSSIDRATGQKLISNVTYLMQTVKQQAAEITALKKTVNQLKLGQKELEDELTSLTHNAEFDY